MRFMSMLPVALVAASLSSFAQAAPASAVVDRFAGPDGGWDYISVDSAAQRLFVGRSQGVMTIDLASRKVTPVFMPADDVAAVLIITGTPLMLSTNGGSNTATLFNRNTGKVKGTVKTGDEPDGALYDSANGLAFVMNGASNDVTFIDIAKVQAVATVPVGGKPEAAALDGKGRLYVNIEDTAEIAVIDIASRKVATRYKLAGCEEPTGLAFDAQTGLLISACHNNTAKLIEAKNGTDRGSQKICAGADGSIFDQQRRQVYIPCFDGNVSVFALDKDGKAGAVRNVVTESGARTAALDPKTGLLYLPRADYAKDANGKRQRVAGTFSVLVVKP